MDRVVPTWMILFASESREFVTNDETFRKTERSTCVRVRNSAAGLAAGLDSSNFRERLTSRARLKWRVITGPISDDIQISIKRAR